MGDAREPRSLFGRQRTGETGRAPGQDLERIDDLLDPTADAPGALLLSGEPGVGKTALLNAVAQRASAAGTRVLRAAGAEFETDMTYSGLNQILFPPA